MGDGVVDLKGLKKRVVEHIRIHGKYQDNIILPGHLVVVDGLGIQDAYIPFFKHHGLPVDRLVEFSGINVLHLNIFVTVGHDMIKSGMPFKIYSAGKMHSACGKKSVYLFLPEPIHMFPDLFPGLKMKLLLDIFQVRFLAGRVGPQDLLELLVCHICPLPSCFIHGGVYIFYSTT